MQYINFGNVLPEEKH